VKLKLRLLAALLFYTFLAYSQVDVILYEQFNGRYDFTFVGNTLNTGFNGANTNPCEALTTSAASLNLSNGDQVQAAYLYWAGSGTGDFNVKLNGQQITAERTFDLVFTSPGEVPVTPRPFFSAFANVTALVQATGNGVYTLSDLDLSNVINMDVDPSFNIYCKNGTSFGGWVIVVVFKNDNIGFNQLNVYDGLQNIPYEVNITLNGLNIIDNAGAKTGFVAWEGDPAIATGESLKINGGTLSNAANPFDNAFNGTNSVTGSNQMYNMDLDIYDISNNVNIGDTSAQIQLTSIGDFVMINAIVTRLFSIAPDATVTVEGTQQECDSRTVTVNYTVHNDNATNFLPAQTPVSVYLNGDYYGYFKTQNDIPIGGSESGAYTVTLPAGAPDNFQIIFIADDLMGTGNSTIDEIDEENNSYTYNGSVWVSPTLTNPADITACAAADFGIFDFSAYTESLKQNPSDVVTFYTTMAAAQQGTDFIEDTSAFQAIANPQTIYVRLTDVHGCFGTAQFSLLSIACADAVVTIDDVYKQCNSRILHVHYTVTNNSTTVTLPAGTPVSIYVNGAFLAGTETTADLAPGAGEEGFILLTIPIGIPLDFNLTFVADDTGDGTGIITETDENNNDFTLPTTLVLSPELAQPADMTTCDKGFGLGTFDFSAYAETLANFDNEVVTFYHSQPDADQALNAIYNTSAYTTTQNPERIYVRLDNSTCHTTASFLLHTKKCAPVTYNYVTPNGDGYNDTFFVEGLRNIFLNFKMSIYNRYGSLVWTGNHSVPDWDGIAGVAKVGSTSTTVPNGTYYFVLELNDPDFTKPIVGWVYVTM